MPPLSLTPLSSLHISAHFIPKHGRLPNTTPHSHPLLIYHSAFPASTSASVLEVHLPRNAISPAWRYTMYSTTHYHSTSHEVLCVFRGRARLLFGGEQNPERVEIECGAGDAIVIPAGVAHRLVRDVDGKFEMVGAYPRGRGWDMCYGVEGEEKKAEKVKEVEWFKKDPLYGDDGLRCGVGRGWKERVVGKEVANCKVVDWKERATQLTERSALALSKINPPPTFS